MNKGEWSGKRDSNPRPLPWQGNALPAELFPHFMDLKVSHYFILSMMTALISHGRLKNKK